MEVPVSQAVETTQRQPQLSPEEEQPAGGTFRSLRHHGFRMIWIGTLFSSSGQWIQQVTLGWLVYEMTGSGVALGLVNGFRAIPLLFLGPFGGVAADRVERKRLMLATQFFLAATAAIVGTMIIAGQLQLWHLFAFSLLTGVAWAFNMPVRQSVVPNLVPERHLMNALALNSAGFNITRIAGPSLAGLLISELGPAENFYIQAIAYLCVSLSVAQVAIPRLQNATRAGSVGQNLAEGARFVWNHGTLRLQMMLALVPVIIALPYSSLMPIFARDVLHRGAGGFGLMMAAPGSAPCSAR
jgi:MFS family permease